MAFAPLIARLYGPEALGFLGTFQAIVGVVVPLATLAYPIAIVLPKHNDDALGLVRLCVYSSIFMSTLIVIALLASGDAVLTGAGMDSMKSYMFLIPVATMFAAWMHIGQHWLVRQREFGVIAKVSVIHTLILNGLKTGVGLFQPMAVVLIVLATIGYALHSVLLYACALRRHKRTYKSSNHEASTPLRSLAAHYSDFPLYRAPQNFINAVSQGLPILMLAAFFGPLAAGFYSIGRLVMGLPSGLVGKSVSDVFYPKIAEAAQTGRNVSDLIVKATAVLSLVAAMPFGVIVLFGPSIFGFVFGPEWSMAGEYARWLSVFYFFNLINKPSVASVPILGIQRGLLVYEVFSTISKVLGLVIGFYFYESDLAAVALFSIIGAIAYSLMMIWIISASNDKNRYVQAG